MTRSVPSRVEVRIGRLVLDAAAAPGLARVQLAERVEQAVAHALGAPDVRVRVASADPLADRIAEAVRRSIDAARAEQGRAAP